jgi:hypothetical protein
LKLWGLEPFVFVAFAFVFFCAATFWVVVKLRKLGSGAKLLSLTGLLHLCVMSVPALALFVHPIITIGHDIQYHLLCWKDGNQRARSLSNQPLQAPKSFFTRNSFFEWIYGRSGVLIFLLFAFAIFSTSPFLFTDLLYRLISNLPFPFSDILLQEPAEKVKVLGNHYIDPAPLAHRLISAFCIGFAAQHYYLDSKIWKLSRDKETLRKLEKALS